MRELRERMTQPRDSEKGHTKMPASDMRWPLVILRLGTMKFTLWPWRAAQAEASGRRPNYASRRDTARWVGSLDCCIGWWSSLP